MLTELFMECHSAIEDCLRGFFCPRPRVVYHVTDPRSFHLIERQPSPQLPDLYDDNYSSSSYDDFVAIDLPDGKDD